MTDRLMHLDNSSGNALLTNYQKQCSDTNYVLATVSGQKLLLGVHCDSTEGLFPQPSWSELR